ncbi:MAG TPA: hypothetical protein VI455_16180 [Terriglobia bacterium]
MSSSSEAARAVNQNEMSPDELAERMEQRLEQERAAQPPAAEIAGRPRNPILALGGEASPAPGGGQRGRGQR